VSWFKLNKTGISIIIFTVYYSLWYINILNRSEAGILAGMTALFIFRHLEHKKQWVVKNK